MDIKPFFGLIGVLIAAMTSEFNDQVTSIALIDVRGALGISHDPGTWIQSLYVSAEIIGMAISPWLLMTFTLRRWTLFTIALCGASSVLIPFSANIEAIYALRLLQGLAGGLIIPLVMTTAFRILTPNIRLYGLAIYALTATFTPALASTVAAFWTDIVDWRFVFLQTIPLCALAGVLVWYCLHQDQPRYERLRMLDWRGALLLVIGTGACCWAMLPARSRPSCTALGCCRACPARFRWACPERSYAAVQTYARLKRDCMKRRRRRASGGGELLP